jgi:hypothetical protein
VLVAWLVAQVEAMDLEVLVQVVEVHKDKQQVVPVEAVKYTTDS